MSRNTFKYIMCYIAIGSILMGLVSCKKKEDAPRPLTQSGETVKAVNGIDIGYTKFQIEGYNFILINVKGTNQYQILEWHGER